MTSLLERARKLTRLLQRSESVEYDSISRVLSNVLSANVYIAGRTGKIFGYAFIDDFACDRMLDNVINQGNFPAPYAQWLLQVDETSANLRAQDDGCAFEHNGAKCMLAGKNTTVVPIYGVGERIGTLIIARFNDAFTDEDLLLAEYGAAVVGMEMLRDHTQKVEVEARKQAAVQIALATLSYSEARAAVAIFGELEGTEGLLVASRIADNAKLTRSVIVNALRKFESAGVIEAKSMGMRGTHIKVLNDHLLAEIKRLKL